MIPFQSSSKMWLKSKLVEEAKKTDSKERISLTKLKYYSLHPLCLRGDRTVGNTLEGAVVFLPLLWIHALFVDHEKSFSIAMAYVISRALYPFGFGSPLVLLSTFPGYFVLYYLMYAIGMEVFTS